MSTKVTEQSNRVIEVQQKPVRPALGQEFRVGDWRVLPQLNRIVRLKNLEERQLEPRLVKLLCFLAANEEHVLSREELVQELWPRVVVNENSLTRAVSELRKQLQCSDASVVNYIETIPKRGYRLLPRIEIGEPSHTATPPSNTAHWHKLFTMPAVAHRSAVATACLCLLIATTISLNSGELLNRGIENQSDPVFLSDELLDIRPNYQGGRLQLSTMEDDSSLSNSIAAPVVSLDEKQYAFIEHHTAGSTIFLGALDTGIEPVPVYDSNQYLFNLAWSPVGNNLLFAMKPSMSTAALFSTVSETADLLTLNLNTLEISRLIEDVTPAENNSPNGLNLT